MSYDSSTLIVAVVLGGAFFFLLGRRLLPLQGISFLWTRGVYFHFDVGGLLTGILCFAELVIFLQSPQVAGLMSQIMVVIFMVVTFQIAGAFAYQLRRKMNLVMSMLVGFILAAGLFLGIMYFLG